MTTGTVTNTAFVVNMVNAAVGIGLLAKPYALAIAGWYSVISVLTASALVAYIGCLFGLLTLKVVIPSTSYHQVPDKELSQSECEEIDSNAYDTETADENETSNSNENASSGNHSKSVYAVLAHKALGKCGQYYVDLALLVLLYVSFISMLIIEWQCLSQIVHSAVSATLARRYFDDALQFLSLFLLTVPIVFVLSWRQLTFVSLLSVISVAAIVLLVVAVYIMASIEFHGQRVPDEYFASSSSVHDEYSELDTARYAIAENALAVRIFYSFVTFKGGLSATSSIPPLVLALKDKSWANIRRLVLISYLIITAIYTLFGVLGAAVYGTNVDVLILNNLFVWPSGIWVILVTALKIINLWSSYGIYLAVSCEIWEKSFLRIAESAKRQRYLLRFCILLSTCVIAFALRHYLAFVLAIQNAWSAAMWISAPLLLYVCIERSAMSLLSKAFNISLIVALCVIGLIVVSGSTSLVRAQ